MATTKKRAPARKSVKKVAAGAKRKLGTLAKKTRGTLGKRVAKAKRKTSR